VLAQRERGGGESYQIFFAFEAPAAATYSLRLSAPKTYYRYTLLRNSSYKARSVEPLRSPRERPSLHGYLLNPEDQARFTLELAAGEEVGLSVANSQPKVRLGKRRARRALYDGSGAAGMGMGGMAAGKRAASRDGAMAPGGMSRGPGAMTTGGSMAARRGGAEQSFPDCSLHVELDGAVVSSSAHFVLFKAAQAGVYSITVTATSRGEGGLFELALEEHLDKQPLVGHVGGFDGEDVAYVSLRFLREPGLDMLGVATSDDTGRFAIDIAPGPYTVLMTGAAGQAGQVVRTNLAGRRELNLLFVDR
jgi:hypothetical protein